VLRDVLATSVGLADPDRRAPLAKQLAEVMRELDSLPNTEAGNPVDDLKAKRAKRRAASTDKPRPVSGDKRGTRSGGARSGGGSAS